MRSGMLDVGDGHTIYYEEHGSGQPVVVLHGGPGGGLDRAVLRFFDLKKWHVILFDQRGTGKSTPALETRANTTWHLVGDIEKIRQHLGVDRWVVFGGSWGSLLALAYASRHSARVKAMVLRGICLGEPWENRWLYEEGGASRLYPEEWERFKKAAKSRRSPLVAYGRLLRNRRTRKTAANDWTRWESALSYLKPRPDATPEKQATSLAVLEQHYFSHGAWVKPGQLLRAARRLRMPVTIVQGRYDLVCPAASAVALHRALPNSSLIMTHAGHSQMEPETAAALRAAMGGI